MTPDLTPRQPIRPFIWPDILLDVRDLLLNSPQEIYVVGGAVRDAWLHRPLHDIDLVVSADASRIARKIANHFKGDFFVLDDERDVGRALLNTPDGLLIFDVSRFRAPTLLGDLTDRDFTVNALAVDIKSDLDLLIDPLGGEADLNAKLVRRCSPDSLPRDAIRALRAVRQSIQFNFRIEPTTLADVRAAVPLLTEISPERVRDEFIKLLALPKPAAALRVADTLGLLVVIVPEVAPLKGVKQSSPHIYDVWGHTLSVVESLIGIMATISFTRTDNTVASFAFGTAATQIDTYRKYLLAHLDFAWPNERSHRTLLVLAALLHDIGKPATYIVGEGGSIHFPDHAAVGAKLADLRADALKLSAAERQRLKLIVQHHSRLFTDDEWTPLAIHRFWRQTGEAGIDICLLSLADFLGAYGSTLPQNDWLMFIERVRILLEAYYDKHALLVEPPTLVDGNQLIATFDLKPGRIIGELLTLIREAQVTGEVSTAEDALSLARTYLDKT